MSLELWLAFVIATMVLAATPGPSMSLFVANTTTHGFAAGAATVVGNTLGVGLAVSVAALGLSSVMVFVAEWFEVIRWCGVAYLAYLGLRRLWQAYHASEEALAAARSGPDLMAMMRQGFVVAVSNPKVLLFLGAFFPQFVVLDGTESTQLAILAGTFAATIFVTDLALAYAVGRARVLLTRRGQRWSDAVSGSLLLGGSALLASLKR